MFRSKTNHFCTILKEDSLTFLPTTLGGQSSKFEKYKRSLKKLILISETNPRSGEFFTSTSAIAEERRRQLQLNSRVVHPFSVFRLYYEIWMCLVFFVCFIYIPLDASFKHLMQDHITVHNLLVAPCWVDIIMNFCTGFCTSDKEVEMGKGQIAKHYIFGRYFIFDLVSSLPDPFGSDNYRSAENFVDYLAMLKFVRIGTFFTYLNRTFQYYKIRSFWIKLFVMTILVLHYLSCLLYFLPQIHKHVVEGIQKENYQSTEEFTAQYIKTVFMASSILLCIYDIHIWIPFLLLMTSSIGVESIFEYSAPWTWYLFVTIFYFIGRVLTATVTVILVDAYRVHHCIEFKYQEMMSQVNAYMRANQFPNALQKRVTQYYYYRYRQKYFNEERIERYISEKLKKEIRYHDCYSLIQSVTFFEPIPQEVVEHILSFLQKEIFLPGDVIISAGTLGNCMYFISSGTVGVSSPSGKEICHLVDGDYFGEICLVFSNHRTTADVRAIEICELYKLEKRSFKKCMEHAKELYKHIQDVAKKRYDSTKEIERLFISSHREHRTR